MYKAGDKLTVHVGTLAGQVREITSVRVFATDNGYYVKGGEGLYGPDQVSLYAERTGGNPCGADCDARDHRMIGVCDHCTGKCFGGHADAVAS
ncbi:hypothetical protein ACWCXC_31520 [Streptomyces sp. NPDC001515]